MVIVYKNDPVVTDSAKLSWAAKKSKQKQAAYRRVIHGQTETTPRQIWYFQRVAY